jgi:hypothetical protein
MNIFYAKSLDHSDEDIENQLVLDNYQYCSINLILQNCKSQSDKYLKTVDTKAKIKLIKEKTSLLNKKKSEAKNWQSENNLGKSLINKNTENSNHLFIKWDYSVMLQNIQCCTIPRFLIVEVKQNIIKKLNVKNLLTFNNLKLFYLSFNKSLIFRIAI